MGQKMVRFAALSGTRSRQDESVEVGEVGSKRPSSGCNGVHVVRWIGLIFRLLTTHPLATASMKPGDFRRQALRPCGSGRRF
jgi:hypothetical protein